MRGVVFGFLSFCLLPTSVLAVGYILHVGEYSFNLSQTKYTTPSLAFGVPNDGVWYGSLVKSGAQNTLKFKYNDTTYSLCEPFVDTENYTYDENGRLIGADGGIWLEGTGTQYIDTNHKPTTVTRSELDLRFTDDTYKSSGKSGWFGLGTNNQVYGVNFGAGSLQGLHVHSWFCKYQTSGCNDSQISISSEQKTTKQTFIMDAKNKKFKYGSLTRTPNQYISNVTDYTLWLFGGNPSGAYARNNGLFIYAARFYEDDVLVKHFVPVPACMRIGDFVVPENGMWDIVNQQFYGNSGTGEFIYGKD